MSVPSCRNERERQAKEGRAKVVGVWWQACHVCPSSLPAHHSTTTTHTMFLSFVQFAPDPPRPLTPYPILNQKLVWEVWDREEVVEVGSI